MTDKLRTINDFALTLLMQSDLDDIVWTIADRIGSMLGFSDCVIYLRDGDRLIQRAAYGEKQHGERDIRERIEIAVGDGIVGHVARTGRGEIVADTREDPRYIWDQFSGCSELAVPIVFEDEVIGIIDSEAEEPDAFGPEEFELMQSLANMAAPRIASELGKLRLAAAEAELRRSEDELHCIVEAVSDGILTFDERGVIQGFNAAAERIFGYARHEVIGRNYKMLLPPQHTGDYEERIVAMLAGDGPTIWTGIEAEGLTRDGETFPMEVNISRAVAGSGSGFIVGTVRNIAERKRAREALHYRLGFENLIAEISSSFIHLHAFEVDRGIEAAMARIAAFVHADSAYVFRFYDDLKRFSLTHNWNSPYSRRRMQDLQNLDATRYSWWMSRLVGGEAVAVDRLDDLPDEAAAERRVLRSVGVQSIVEVPMMHEGQVTGFLGLSLTREHRNWTEDDVALLQLAGQIVSNALKRKETEEELLKSRAQAQAASRAKSQFLANMSHELRTPLNAIIGYSELLQIEARGKVEQSLLDDLDNIHRAGSHLLNLISDVLDLAKIESGRTEFDFQWFSIAAMVEELGHTAAPLMRSNGNEFRIMCERGIGTMRADQTRVHQVLLNLLSNAAKFTEHGEVTLRATKVVAGGVDCVRFAVTDTGIGIAEDKIRQVFSEFVQADSSTTREFGGTGLGLPISRKLCVLMGGDIEVESEPGLGSTFVVTLPARAGKDEPMRVAPGGG